MKGLRLLMAHPSSLLLRLHSIHMLTLFDPYRPKPSLDAAMHRQGQQASPRRASAGPSPSRPTRHTSHGDHARPIAPGTLPGESAEGRLVPSASAAMSTSRDPAHGGSGLSQTALAAMNKANAAPNTSSERLSIPVPARVMSSSNLSDAFAEGDDEVESEPV